MKSLYNANIISKFDAYSSLEGAKKSEFEDAKLNQIVYVTPIEEVNILNY